eukprot:6184720-Prymnesium_polylepis.2
MTCPLEATRTQFDALALAAARRRTEILIVVVTAVGGLTHHYAARCILRHKAGIAKLVVPRIFWMLKGCLDAPNARKPVPKQDDADYGFDQFKVAVVDG